ncbi:MAG: hypothetical protein LKJ44_06665 [Bifidobacteriaceae bacterium]|nr:hypothetical protein [Bifidobacteriaceae bacterium]
MGEQEESQRMRMADVAELYWVRNMKIDVIAKKLGISRSTVSRLLSQAKENHVLEFTIHRERDSSDDLREQLEQRFRVKAVVVGTGNIHDVARRRLLVGEAASSLLWNMVKSKFVIGVTWGRTTEAISLQLNGKQLTDVQILQLHGFGNTLSFGENYFTEILERFGTAFDAQVHLFPVPAIFDSVETRQMMWRESSVKQILSLRKALDVIVTSVGTPYGPKSSPLFTHGILSEKDIQGMAEDGVVGDVASTFFREDGSTQGIAVNKRSTGLAKNEFLRVPNRIFVGADENKSRALRTVLNSGYVTHLVVDQRTALGILRGDGH